MYQLSSCNHKPNLFPFIVFLHDRGVQKSVISSPFKPRSQGESRFIVNSFETSVDEIVISFATRRTAKDNAAFIRPMIKAFTEDFEDLGGKWSITSFAARRIPGGGNVTMKSSPDSNYYWDAIISIRKDVNTLSVNQIGMNIAAAFSGYSNGKEKYEKQSFEYQELLNDDGPKPVNYYLLDHDVLVLLRMIYSNASKDEILGDEDILHEFFGSTEAGTAVLARIGEVEWEGLL